MARANSKASKAISEPSKVQREAASVYATRELLVLGAVLMLYLASLEKINQDWKNADIQKLRGEVEQNFPQASEFPIWERLYQLRSHVALPADSKQVDESLAAALQVFRVARTADGTTPKPDLLKQVTQSVGNVADLLRRYSDLKKAAKVS